MTTPQAVVGMGTLLSGAGIWLLLPGGGTRSRALGLLLGLAGGGCLAACGLPLGELATAENIVFWSLAALTVIAAAATVTVRNPVYSAIWFALSLMGTAGLFFFQGAQFLGVATIVVYAGAILVTFLFVLMLASPKGHAYYDRVGWEPLLSAATGAVLVGLLTMTISNLLLSQVNAPTADESKSVAAAARQPNGVLNDEHVASLGAQLFSKQLVGVEVAGTLLLVALVGAVAIVAHEKQSRPSPTTRGAQR